MENNGRISQFFSRLGDQIADQVWYQQLKTKWDELDQQSRTYVRAGVLGATTLLVLFSVFSSIWSVHKLKKELAEKSDLLTMIQSANEEMRRLKDSIPPGAQRGSDTGAPWPGYFETTAGAAGIEKTAVAVSNEKAGSATDQAKETLFDLTLKHVNIKQIVRLTFNLENGARPVKVRNLSIDTKNDPSGYLDAVLSVSAFAIKPGT